MTWLDDNPLPPAEGVTVYEVLATWRGERCTTKVIGLPRVMWTMNHWNNCGHDNIRFKENGKMSENANENVTVSAAEKRELSFVKVGVERGFEPIKDIYAIAAREGAYIAGGYVRWMCSPDQQPAPADDVDVFVKDSVALNRVRIMLRRELMYWTGRESDVAYTLTSGCKGLPKVQLIKPIERGALKTFGTLEEIIGSFDFTVVRIGLLSETEALADECFSQDEYLKELNIRTINTPVAVVMRAQKYAEKGYTLSPIEALKLFRDWEGRTPEFRQRLIDLLERERYSQERIREEEATLYWGEDE